MIKKLVNWFIMFFLPIGLQRMMQIASELDEMTYESSMEITENTRTIISCALGKVYDNMYYDLIKESFSAKIEDFIQWVIIPWIRITC